MLITAFTYGRIKKDLDDRIIRQRAAEAEYRETNRRISVMEGVTKEIAGGNYAVRSTDDQDDELGRISKALNLMIGSLEQTFTDLNAKNWLQTGAVKLSNAMRGEKDLSRLGNSLINTIANYLNAPLGTIYLLDQNATFKLAGSYAAQNAPAVIRAGEGLIGQVIKQKKMIVVQDIPADYSRVISSLVMPNQRPW